EKPDRDELPLDRPLQQRLRPERSEGVVRPADDRQRNAEALELPAGAVAEVPLEVLETEISLAEDHRDPRPAALERGQLIDDSLALPGLIALSDQGQSGTLEREARQ